MISILIISQYRTCKEHFIENTSCEYHKVQIWRRDVTLSLFEKDLMAHWARVMATKIPFLQAFFVEYMKTLEFVDFLRALDWIETNHTYCLSVLLESAIYREEGLQTEQSHQIK